eukprot:TRINITY_DN619_c0_g1_i2.p1 TRINITY_DN619_c0_g1~~TRINITY_DN619_c0_g1_i2.p1  ORF type:complete len:257 (-),score=80.04 TRINITY_DN619_c0_g1_i2:13-783(-)
MEQFKEASVYTYMSNTDPFMAPVYQLYKPKIRYQVLNSILRTFEEKEISDIDYLRYTAQILATLPYTTEDEPLFLIHHINRIISLQASTIQNELKPIFKDTPPKTMSKDLIKKCHSMTSMIFLMFLKNHLKVLFSFTDKRCQSFDPSSTSEKPMVKVPDSIPLESNSSPFHQLHSMRLLSNNNFNSWKEVFTKFNSLVKEDGEDFTLSKVKKKGGKRKSNEGAPTTKKRSKKAAPKKKKKEESDEDDDDEMYGEDD